MGVSQVLFPINKTETLEEPICQKILSVCNNYINALKLGFVDSSDSFCRIIILGMINNALQNTNVLTTAQKDHLINIYNKYVK